MNQEIHILSYFSLPTDIASELKTWPEFVSGVDYSANLENLQSGEIVNVELIENTEERYVCVKGTGNGSLFDKVLGRVIYALSAHSDNLIVDRHT